MRTMPMFTKPAWFALHDHFFVQFDHLMHFQFGYEMQRFAAQASRSTGSGRLKLMVRVAHRYEAQTMANQIRTEHEHQDGAQTNLLIQLGSCSWLSEAPHLSSMSNLNVPNYNSVRCTSKLDTPVGNLWTSNKTLHTKLWWVQIWIY